MVSLFFPSSSRVFSVRLLSICFIFLYCVALPTKCRLSRTPNRTDATNLRTDEQFEIVSKSAYRILFATVVNRWTELAPLRWILLIVLSKNKPFCINFVLLGGASLARTKNLVLLFNSTFTNYVYLFWIGLSYLLERKLSVKNRCFYLNKRQGDSYGLNLLGFTM